MLKGEEGIGWEPAAWEWPTPQRLHEDDHDVCAGREPRDKVQVPSHPGRQPGEEVVAVHDERAFGEPHGREHEVPARERQLQLSDVKYRTLHSTGRTFLPVSLSAGVILWVRPWMLRLYCQASVMMEPMLNIHDNVRSTSDVIMAVV